MNDTQEHRTPFRNTPLGVHLSYIIGLVLGMMFIRLLFS